MRKGDGEVADRDGVAIALGEQVEQQVGWVVAAARGERRAVGGEARAAADEGQPVEGRAAEGEAASVHEEEALEVLEALGAGLVHREEHGPPGASVAS